MPISVLGQQSWLSQRRQTVLLFCFSMFFVVYTSPPVHVGVSAWACGPSCPLLVFVPELWHPMLHLSLFFQLVSDLCSFVSAAVDMTKDRCFHHDWQRCHKGWVERHGAQETAMGSELMCFHWCRVGWVPQTIKGNTSWFSNLKSDAFDTCIDWLIIEFGTNTCEFFYTNDKLSLVVFYLIQLQNFKGIW